MTVITTPQGAMARYRRISGTCSAPVRQTFTPNIRYKAAKLLVTGFPPGSEVVGSYTVLIVNKRDFPDDAIIPGAGGGRIRYLAADLGKAMYKEREARADRITLSGLEVAILTMPHQRDKH